MWRIIVSLFFINFVICYKITPIPTPLIKAGTSLHWDNCTQSVYFVDFLAFGRDPFIFRYDYEDDVIYSAYIEGESFPIYIYPVGDCNENKDLFAVGLGDATKIVEWNKNSPVAKVVDTLFEISPKKLDSRLCIGNVNQHGILYTGTYSPLYCAAPKIEPFFSYSKQNGLQRLFDDSIATTGVAFDTDAKKLYHLDSCQQLITSYDENSETGKISNRQVVYNFRKSGGFQPLGSKIHPVGLETDTDGMLYVAEYINGSIAKIDPRKSAIVDIIDVPVKGITSITWAGPQKDILFGVSGAVTIDMSNGVAGVSIFKDSFLYMITELGAKGHEFGRLEI